MSEIIATGKRVTFHFKMFSMQGDCLGSSEGQQPLAYTHGVDPIDPPGLAEHLEGKPDGYEGEVVLPPEKAYGENLLPPEESVAFIPKESFEGIDLAPGMMLMANIGDKGDLPITVMEVRANDVVVYYGHPLAGQHLRFELKVISVA